MGKALEVIAGDIVGVVAAGTFTGLTAHTGNSFTVRNAKEGSDVWLLTCWADTQLNNSFRIRSPRLHDNVQGLRFETVASELLPLLSPRYKQRLTPQDTLTVEMDESTAALDVQTGCLLVYYDDLPGVDGQFIGLEELKSRGVRLVTVENTIDTGVGGDWLTAEALNAEFDLLKANTDYALVGYQCSVETAAIRWRGSDVGNLGVGGPGDIANKDFTAEWFIWLTEMAGLPLIPVFNSANRAAILLDAAQDENLGDPVVSSIFVELAPAG